ncbi:MAG: OmpA family protein [Pseudobdellovibrionaceae bacterium]|nr:OmpA family protein [Pseudobdellovibrionaceae bacterium]
MKLLGTVLLTLLPMSAASAPQVWLGASGGYTHIVPDGSGQTSKNGYHLFLDASAETTTGNWNLGLGGGFFYNRVYSDGERDFPTDDPDVVREQRNLRIETRAGSAALSARYRLWDGHIEAGLLIRHLFGSSLSFSQDKDSSQSKFFVGPQLILKTAADTAWMQRVDLNLTSDLNVPKRRVYLLAAGFAIGRTWPITQPPQPEPASKPAERFEEILADKVINFPSGSSQLQEPALTFLKEFGQFLQKHPEHWQSMTVEGHTDKKGKLDYNMKLSQDRSDAVRRVIVDQGVVQGKVHAQGFGPTRPLKDGDSPEILALNRRVVMVFTISHREGRQEVSREIQRLRQKHFGE